MLRIKNQPSQFCFGGNPRQHAEIVCNYFPAFVVEPVQAPDVFIERKSNRQEVISERAPVRRLKVSDSIMKFFDMECSRTHNLTPKLIAVAPYSLLPGLSIYGHQNAEAI